MPKCKKCGAPIVFVKTPENKWIPCNAELTEYKLGDTPDYEDRIVTEDGVVHQCTFDFQCEPDGLARIPHWATCPYGDYFRS